MLSVRSLTISIDDVLGRLQERRRNVDVERARGIEVDDETGLPEILERNLLRVLAADDARGEMRGVAAAVVVVARDDDHRTADRLRFLKCEHRHVRAPRGFA